MQPKRVGWTQRFHKIMGQSSEPQTRPPTRLTALQVDDPQRRVLQMSLQTPGHPSVIMIRSTEVQPSNVPLICNYLVV